MAKILLDAIFSGISLTESFLCERLHSENVKKIICNISSGRFDVHLQVTQPILKGPRTVSNSICRNSDSLWLGYCITDNFYFCGLIKFPIGILGQVWYLIVSIPDLCTLTNFNQTLTLSAPSKIKIF